MRSSPWSLEINCQLPRGFIQGTIREHQLTDNPPAEACKSLIEVLNMEALGGTESPTSTSVHTLNLSGMVAGGGGKVLARCRMTYAAGQGVTLELGVRSEKEEVGRLVMSAI